MTTAPTPTVLKPPKLATCHPERKEWARGMCTRCYRADMKARSAAKALERAKTKEVENDGVPPVRDLEKDPETKRRFLEIMWEWLEAPQRVEAMKCGSEGKRDYATEARLQEIAQRKADKAATVLGRAYVVEKREEIKPVPLPLGNEIDASGWEDAPDAELDEIEEVEEIDEKLE